MNALSSCRIVFRVLQPRSWKSFAMTSNKPFCSIVVNSLEPKAKRPCSDIRIGTHDGTFHCDELLACFLLKCLPEYTEGQIVRSRKEEILKQCDIVVDVGGIFDPLQHRYDHHQRSFNETMNSLNSSYPWTTKLSSAGLVYFHFGHRILSDMLSSEVDKEKMNAADSKKIDIIFRKVYENFMEEIDAIDNGINTHDGNPRYCIRTNLSSRVQRMNPAWNKKEDIDEDYFTKALAVVGLEFVNSARYYSSVWWPARTLVHQAVDKRCEVYNSGEIIEFSDGGCPWKEHLEALEKELCITPCIKYVIYPDANQNWRVQCVPVSSKTFENRLSLKNEWQGLRNEELSKISGIPDCIFVHANGFIGGNKTREGAIKMATETLMSSKPFT